VDTGQPAGGWPPGADRYGTGSAGSASLAGASPAGASPAGALPAGALPGREPLRAGELRPTLIGDRTGLWRAFTVVGETGSTNADLVAAARAGAAEGTVLVAEYQRAGRGRADRRWASPPGAGLTVSVLLRPGAARLPWPPAPATSWGWLPLLAGVALAESVTAVAGRPASLKWPNDLLVGGGKCAGILAEAVGEAVVIGIGLNVTTRPDELPPPADPAAPPAGSLALATAGTPGRAAAGTPDRAALLVAVLGRIEHWYGGWRLATGDAGRCGLWAAYRRLCDTLGRPVQVLLPAGDRLRGIAETVDGAGRLVLRTGDEVRALAAGDVAHLRPVVG
jgi:BirA family biotin operon repressor/biotin-[acetyl-CoA-carboxylase] ligase